MADSQPSRRRLLQAFGAALSIGVAGCSSSTDDSTTTGSSDGTTTTPTATLTPTVTTTSSMDTPTSTTTSTPTTTTSTPTTTTASTTTTSTTTTSTPTTTTASTTTTTADGTPTPSGRTLPPGKVVAGDGDAGDRFGAIVSLADDGSDAIVGAYRDDDTAKAAGSAYLFANSGGTWSKEAKLTPEDADENDWLGAVSLSGEGSTAVVGTYRASAPERFDDGSAYVFTESGSTWSQQAELTPYDAEGGKLFGTTVGLSGDGSTALVGAVQNEGPTQEPSRAAYVFVSSGGEWSQQATLSPSSEDPNDRFAAAVDLSESGSTALVGAPGDEDPGELRRGSAYVYGESGGAWSEQAELTPTDRDGQDRFGASVSLAGDGSTALVGAPGDEDPNGEDAGSAYVFTASAGIWSQRAELAPADGDAEDAFGATVRLSNDGSAALVGAPGDEDPNGEGAGSAYVFTLSGGSWAQETKLAAQDGDADDAFGSAGALSGTGSTALVGAPMDDSPGGDDAGSAYVFDI